MSHYTNYYREDQELKQWRDLSARDKAANIMRLCASVEHDQIVEIGCGDGAILERLVSAGFGSRWVGLEISSSGLDVLRSRCLGPRVAAIPFDGQTIPCPDESFDLAVLSHVVEHLEHPRQLLFEARRVARYVFVEVPLELNRGTPRDFIWTPVGHVNLYNPLLFRHLLQSTGMEVLAERVMCPSLEVFQYHRAGWPGWLHWAIKACTLQVSPGLATRLFTYHGSLLARSD